MAWGKGGTDSSGGASMTLSSVQASNFVQILQYQEDGGYSKWTFGVSSALTSGYNQRSQRMNDGAVSDGGNPDTGGSFYSNAQTTNTTGIFTVIQFENISGNKKTWYARNVYDKGSGDEPELMSGGGSNDDTTGVWGKIISTGNSSYDTSKSNLTALVDGHTATTLAYPNLLTNTIFETSDTGKHYIWNGSTTWTEVA